MLARANNKKLKTKINNLKETIKQLNKDIKLLENKLNNNLDEENDKTIINYNDKKYKDRV
jgi:gas vesicle protein